MSRNKDFDEEVHFKRGYRSEAIKLVMEMVKKSGHPTELVICNDLPGIHTGGEDCFCDPLILEIDPEDL